MINNSFRSTHNFLIGEKFGSKNIPLDETVQKKNCQVLSSKHQSCSIEYENYWTLMSNQIAHFLPKLPNWDGPTKMQLSYSYRAVSTLLMWYQQIGNLGSDVIYCHGDHSWQNTYRLVFFIPNAYSNLKVNIINDSELFPQTSHCWMLERYKGRFSPLGITESKFSVSKVSKRLIIFPIGWQQFTLLIISP